MLQQDSFRPRPWIGRFACLAVAFYGVCGLGDVALSIFKVVGPSRHSRSVDYYLSDTGIPLRLTYVDDVVVSVTDPEGNPPKDKKLQPDQVRSHIKFINRFSENIGDAHGWRESPYRYSYRNFSRYATYSQAYAYPRAEQWFHLREQQVWICYSPLKKGPLDRLDRRGFRPLSSQPEPFGEETLYEDFSENLIVNDQGKTTFFLRPQRRGFELALPSLGPIYGMSTAYANVAGGNRSVSVVGMTLADRLAVYDEKGALVAALPYHQDVGRWGQLSLGMKGDKERFYLQYEPSAWLAGDVRARMPTYLEEVTAQGDVIQSYTLSPVPPFWRSRSWPDYVAKRLQSPAFFFGGMSYQKVGAWLGSQRLADQLSRRFGHDREQTKEWTTFILPLSLALAIAAWFWSRRARFSVRRALGWSLLVFAGGLAGLIAFRAVTDWPQFVACPRCRRPRPIDDESCPNCGADWPAATTDETEIFDDRTAATLAMARS